jgi:putative serine protease PepD
MTQQDIHPDPARTSPDEPTSAPQPAHEWFGQASAETTGIPTHEPTEAPATPQAPESGRAFPSYGFGTPDPHEPRPDWYGTPATGGTGHAGTYPPAAPTPTPAPKAKPNRGLGQMTAVAILAAALASGGTYAATRYAPAPASSPAATTQSNGATSPQVIQGNAAAPDWTATAKAVGPSVVSISVQSGQAEGQGSGVIIDNQAHILTNNHVATGAGTTATINVTLSDGRTYDAKIVGTDASTDLAVLQLVNPPSDLVPISIGDSSQLTVGQPVMAIGNPLGLSGTVTTGIVSALNRPVTTQAAEGNQGQQGQQGQLPGLQQQQQSASDTVVTNAIQTSAAINPGNSGGALVTADGKLIGINSSIASLGSSQGGQSGNIGIGFAIPVNEAKSIADQLIATGTAQHAYIGVSASDTTVTDGNSKRQAALVQNVVQGSPAAQAGLQAQDAVVAVDGQPIDSSEALVANIHERKVGDTVTVTVIRGSQKQDLKITLAARPG